VKLGSRKRKTAALEEFEKFLESAADITMCGGRLRLDFIYFCVFGVTDLVINGSLLILSKAIYVFPI
jgi:hypothetical protein